jgi:protein TonB
MIEVAQLLESRRARMSRWAAAAVIICALHGGGAAVAFLHWHEEDFDAAAEALTIDMAPLSAAAPVDAPELAHGPERQQAKLTTEAAKQVVEEVERNVPPIDSPLALEPEVPLPNAQREKNEVAKEKEPEEAAPKPAPPQQDHEVPLTTAPRRVEAKPAPSSARSPGGQSASLAREQARWQSGLVSKLNRFKRYPDAASRRDIRGMAIVRFTVDRTGRVVASDLVQSSGSSVLDGEAVALLKRVSPLPAPPESLPDALLQIDVPLWFGMKPNR